MSSPEFPSKQEAEPGPGYWVDERKAETLEELADIQQERIANRDNAMSARQRAAHRLSERTAQGRLKSLGELEQVVGGRQFGMELLQDLSSHADSLTAKLRASAAATDTLMLDQTPVEQIVTATPHRLTSRALDDTMGLYYRCAEELGIEIPT